MREIELAVKLHNWYLEAICELDDEHFNKKAQKSYEELSAEQQGIDIYIAKKLLALIEPLENRLAEYMKSEVEYEKENTRLREALEGIKKHIKTIFRGKVQMSTVWRIANNALKPQDKP